MKNKHKYYFLLVKSCCVLALPIYYVCSSEKSLHQISVEWFLLATSLLTIVVCELIHPEFEYSPERPKTKEYYFNLLKNKKDRLKFSCLLFEVLTICLLFILCPDNVIGVYLLPILLLDLIVFIQVPIGIGILAFLGVLIQREYFYIYCCYTLFVLMLYYQNYVIIEQYRQTLNAYEKKEYLLKNSIHSKDVIYREQLEKSRLAFENTVLEERAQLSQALHDKLGHSINGSIYQLEAGKVLMTKNRDESQQIIQKVIDNLRTSMDEIRTILQREKPDKKRMAYLQLLQLCEECKDKYNILVDVTIEGENKDIPELVWDSILDNTIEAVTNALKYSKCSKIAIEIILMHKAVRCSIEDNGIGCNIIREGMGMQGMRERIRKVNGYIDFNGDNGFRINMIIHLVSVNQK